MPKKNVIFVRANSLARHAIVRYGRKQLGVTLLAEYPKSGGSWVGEMLSAALNVPFPRNKLPVLGSQILHGHYMPNGRPENTYVVVRDGRDVMVSYYYHCFFENEHFNGGLVERTRRILDIKTPENIEENLPRFIESLFTRKLFPKFTWSEFVTSWIEIDGYVLKYEDLLADAPGVLQSAIKSVAGIDVPSQVLEDISERYSFQNMSKRKPGVENTNSFMRKGIAGDWKNSFSNESRSVFDHYAGKELIKLRYEKDRSWVSRPD